MSKAAEEKPQTARDEARCDKRLVGCPPWDVCLEFDGHRSAWVATARGTNLTVQANNAEQLQERVAAVIKGHLIICKEEGLEPFAPNAGASDARTTETNSTTK